MPSARLAPGPGMGMTRSWAVMRAVLRRGMATGTPPAPNTDTAADVSPHDPRDGLTERTEPMKLNDGACPEQVTVRWNRALDGYAVAVARELTALNVGIIDWFVDVTEAPFWIDLALVDTAGQLVEFYFSDDLGWLHARGEHCGRLTLTTGSTPAEHAAGVAVPPSRVAAEILRALAGHQWTNDPPASANARATEPDYLAALLVLLEHHARPAPP
jgi:hypothetical protein